MSDTPTEPTEPQRSQAEASAPLVRMLRSAYISGVGVKLDAKSASELANHIEELAKLVDMMVVESRRLMAQQRDFQAQVDELQGMCDFLKDLVIQSQKPENRPKG